MLKLRQGLIYAALGVLLVLVALTVFLWSAPASWADAIVSQATSGRVRLAESQGKLWAGSAKIALVDPSSLGDTVSNSRIAANDAALIRSTALAGVVIPGRCRWDLAALPLLIGNVRLQLQFDNMAAPVFLVGDRAKLTGSAGALDLPAVRLDRLGSPWNTIQPNAALSVKWDAFVLERGQFVGKAALTVSQVGSALSPINPLGSYRIDLDSTPQKAALVMVTLNGPLQLDGQGDWTVRTGLRFIAYAQAQAEQAKLQPLLGLLGKREGDRTVIRLGAV